MSEFLSNAPKDYEVKSGSNHYYKFQEGENRFRVLANPILGKEAWTAEQGGKPVRCTLDENLPEGLFKVKEFWAMPVWDYKDTTIKILEITQTGIKRTIQNLSEDEDWGSPLEYDLAITRKGEGLDTEYTVTPKPKKQLDPVIGDAFKAVTIRLEALYEGKDPFEDVGDNTAPEVTTAASDKETQQIKDGEIPF